MDRAQADIQDVIADKGLFTPFNHATVLVTGATGLIGSMLIKTLLAADDRYGLGLKIIGQIRDQGKARAIFGDLVKKIELTTTDRHQCDYIVHTVSPTTSKYFIEHPVETIQTSVGTTMSILDAARACGANVVYLSSMEQYGVPYTSGERMTEDKIGVIDHLNIRSSYSESKRLCECLCASYAAEYGVKVRIARLAQTFGAGVPATDNRMPVQFARSAAEGQDIVLHTEGKSVSNFVYLTDALTAILTLMQSGTPGEAYNVCNDRETRSVRDIAQLVAEQVAGGRIAVRVELRQNMGYAPDTAMYLCSDKLRALGWEPKVGMVEAYGRLCEYIRSNS